VLPYLGELRGESAEIRLLTFEETPPGAWDGDTREEMFRTLEAKGVTWSYLRYHKTPTVPATAFDIGFGALRIAHIARRCGVDVVHCRGHVPMAMGAIAKRACRSRLLFDIRGFMPEEYVDAGVWRPGGHLYRVTKQVERHLLAAADAFVVLTRRAQRSLFGEGVTTDARGRPISVIPCCVDLSEFAVPQREVVREAKVALGLLGRRVYVYVGQLGGWYLDHALVDFLDRARAVDPSSFALIVTPSPSLKVKKELALRGFREDDALVCSAAPSRVPDYLLAGDVGLSFIKPCSSKISSSPTKVGEYLAAGLPVLSTEGIGDLDDFLIQNRAGVILKSLERESFDSALLRLSEFLAERDLRMRLRAVAEQTLSLEKVGGPLYRDLYARLCGRDLMTW
jgi:glycosyltransferase involved in cell wall biosynthesis